MAWEVGTDHRYRGRAKSAQPSKNKNGTKSIEAIIEVTSGPMTGQTIKYRGYVSGPNGSKSPQNEKNTADELRAMGASLARGWGDFTGLGSKEVSFCVMKDESENDEGKTVTYYRAAFVRAPMALNSQNRLSDDELADLGAPPPASAVKANGAPARGDAFERGDEDEEVAFP